MRRIGWLLIALLGLACRGAVADGDKKAEALLTRARELAERSRTLQADLRVTSDYENRVTVRTGRLRAMKPYEGEYRPHTGAPSLLGEMTLKSSGEPGEDRYVAERGRVTVQYSQRREFQESSVNQFTSQAGFPVVCFFAPPTLGLQKEARYTGRKRVAGVEYEVVEANQAYSTGRKHPYVLYFGPSGLLEGYEIRYQLDGEPVVNTAWMRNLRLDLPMKAEQFAWVQPAGYVPFDADRFQRQVLAVGATAPAFDLALQGAGKTSLAENLKGKKAVLVNFWFRACGPCRVELPHLQKLYTRLRESGLGVITINTQDTAEEVREFMAKHQLTLPVALGKNSAGKAVQKAYGVEVCPTSFLLDRDGQVLWRAIGYRDFTETAFRDALAQAGLQAP